MLVDIQALQVADRKTILTPWLNGEIQLPSLAHENIPLTASIATENIVLHINSVGRSTFTILLAYCSWSCGLPSSPLLVINGPYAMFSLLSLLWRYLFRPKALLDLGSALCYRWNRQYHGSSDIPSILPSVCVNPLGGCDKPFYTMAISMHCVN